MQACKLIDWQEIDTPFENTVNIAFGNDIFLVEDDDRNIYYSKNGYSWAYASTLPEEVCYNHEMTFAGEYFYLYGSDGNLWASKDGKDFENINAELDLVRRITYFTNYRV